MPWDFIAATMFRVPSDIMVVGPDGYRRRKVSRDEGLPGTKEGGRREVASRTEVIACAQNDDHGLLSLHGLIHICRVQHIPDNHTCWLEL